MNDVIRELSYSWLLSRHYLYTDVFLCYGNAYSNTVTLKARLGVTQIVRKPRNWLRWLRSTVVEFWSLTGELSLYCARPTANGLPLM